jgi:ferrous iron transport protein B
MSTLTIALAGNPNAGKSTLFNALTGLHQHTGNWPGKTVEQRSGVCQSHGHTLNVVDLPGTYSLAAYSPEEVIARDFILYERPDVVVNVVDATNLERNLYLTVQLLELEVPLVVALNLADVAQRMRLRIDTAKLSQQLAGTPVVEISARRGDGVDELLRQVVTVTAFSTPRPLRTAESAEQKHSAHSAAPR